MKNKGKIIMTAVMAAVLALPGKTGGNFAERLYKVEAQQLVTPETLSLQDGTYQVEVTLEGGSGRAYIESPTQITVKNGEITAKIVFSSEYYDYVLVDGKKYEPVNETGNSAFEIPVPAFDYALPVVADTVAMSEAHEIEYTITFHSDSIAAGEKEDAADTKETESLSEETKEEIEEENDFLETIQGDHVPVEIPGLQYTHTMDLKYASQFAVDYYEGDYAVISIANEGEYLVVPEGKEVPEGLEKDITVLQQPFDHIYLVATSVMDIFRALDGIDHITLSGTSEQGWYIEEAKTAMREGRMSYAGKYSAPDYELILANGCDLAIESTMIYHSPVVKEKLEGFGIPVLVEHSSYESNPLGRTEWIKLYAVLLDKEEEAEAYFESQLDALEEVLNGEKTGKTVAFFSINSNGSVTVRKSGDYVVKMIEMAGGEYAFKELGGDDSAISTMKLQMEEFYAVGKEADYLIYNSTIEDELYSMDELLGKNALLKDFKSVQNGNVWCTQKSLFQETTGFGTMISDIHRMLTEEEVTQLTYMNRLQ